MIDKNSPLKNLSADLPADKILFFDAIRYSINMADLAFLRLEHTLENTANDKDKKSSEIDYFTPAVLDIWSIIDCVHRLRGLLHQVGGIKKKSVEFQIFDRNAARIIDLRNSFQHINTNIKQVLKLNIPVWGLISWVSIKDISSGEIFSNILSAGSLKSFKSGNFINPLGKSIKVPVDMITLTASGKTIDVSELMKNVAKITKLIEEYLETNFDCSKRAGSDLFASATFSVKQK